MDQQYRKENGDYVWRYQFTSYTPGTVSLPPLLVRAGPQTFSTERTTLEIHSLRPPGDLSLRPDAGSLSVPLDWGFWFLWGLLCATAVGLFFGGRTLWKKHLQRPRRPPAAPPVPTENPLDWLRKQLLILRATLDTQPSERLPDKWSAIVREFAERQQKQPVTAWTTSEILVRLGQKTQLVQMAQLMVRCDEYKFRPRRGSEAAHQLTVHLIQESERIFL